MKTKIARRLVMDTFRIEVKKKFHRDQVLILGKNREVDEEARSQSTWQFYSIEGSKYFA
jgi:alanine racemase